MVEKNVKICLFVFTEFTNVTDRRSYRQTPHGGIGRACIASGGKNCCVVRCCYDRIVNSEDTIASMTVRMCSQLQPSHTCFLVCVNINLVNFRAGLFLESHIARRQTSRVTNRPHCVVIASQRQPATQVLFSVCCACFFATMFLLQNYGENGTQNKTAMGTMLLNFPGGGSTLQ